MKYGKKILSVFLLVIMVVSMLPINSYAANSEGIVLIWDGSKYINIGDNLYLSVHNRNVLDTLYYNDDCTWSSSNTSIATVNQNGVVTGISFGKATITASTKDGKYSATCDVTVKCDEITMEASEVKIDVNEVYFLRVACPMDDELINWGMKQNGNIVDKRYDTSEFYNDEGFRIYIFRIKGISEGVGTFSVESNNTGKIYSCQIIVGDPNPTPDPTPTPDPSPTPSTDSMKMYRLYNPNSGEHFYTSDVSERNMLSNIGWKYEGVAWNVPLSGNPVYRLFNPYTGEHHYTTDVVERDVLATNGWNYEGVGWNSPDSGTPVYRLFNSNMTGQYAAGAHHYTTDAAEKDYLASVGWTYEGIAWYGQR